jgi:N-acetylglucosamine repressor
MSRTTTLALGREHIRSLNQSAVINAIHRHGRISRSDLAAELRLSPAAVTAITSAFISEGLVFEAEQGESTTVGRKPILLEINYSHAFAFGVKVSNAAVTTVLTNLKAEVINGRTYRLAQHDVSTVLQTITDATCELQERFAIPPTKLIGLGINLPGIVEHHSGRVRHSPLLGWYDVPFAELLGRRLGLPVLVENDVDALAAAEAWFGLGSQHDTFLVVTLGRGVGLGIVIDGRVYRGPHGGAGEFGHITVTPPPRLSPVPGPLERFLADEALLAQARARIPHFPSDAKPEDLTCLGHEGHAEALELFTDAGVTLGFALSYLVNIFAPTLIILSGEGVRNAPFLLPHARTALAAHSFGDLAEQLTITVDTWGDDAWARGAAGLVASRYFAVYPAVLGGEN